MGDSWRFDPNKDYLNDEDEGNNFRRFKKSKHKKNNQQDFEKSYGKSYDKKNRPHKNNWR